jgi:pimeloyl-ACP methyl ester carboxylesterase
MIELGSGQESFPALLWEPAPESRANRAIIVVHGGPFGQEYPFWNAARAALLAEGWTVLALNYHGSSGNGAVPVVEKESRESVRRGMEQQIRDVCIGAQFIRSRFSGKIQLYLEGESYGTHLVLAALTQLDPLPDGIVLKATLPRTLPPVPAERAPLRIAAFHGEEDWLASPQSAFSYLDHIFSKRPMLKMSFAEEGHVLRRQSSWQKLHQLAYDRAEPE